MHDCPACGQACDCDMEDHEQDSPDECFHQCDDEDEYSPYIDYDCPPDCECAA